MTPGFSPDNAEIRDRQSVENLAEMKTTTKAASYKMVSLLAPYSEMLFSPGSANNESGRLGGVGVDAYNEVLGFCQSPGEDHMEEYPIDMATAALGEEGEAMTTKDMATRMATWMVADILHRGAARPDRTATNASWNIVGILCEDEVRNATSLRLPDLMYDSVFAMSMETDEATRAMRGGA